MSQTQNSVQFNNKSTVNDDNNLIQHSEQQPMFKCNQKKPFTYFDLLKDQHSKRYVGSIEM